MIMRMHKELNSVYKALSVLLSGIMIRMQKSKCIEKFLLCRYAQLLQKLL